jgi:hypothetical protein
MNGIIVWPQEKTMMREESPFNRLLPNTMICPARNAKNSWRTWLRNSTRTLKFKYVSGCNLLLDFEPEEETTPKYNQIVWEHRRKRSHKVDQKVQQRPIWIFFEGSRKIICHFQKTR